MRHWLSEAEVAQRLRRMDDERRRRSDLWSVTEYLLNHRANSELVRNPTTQKGSTMTNNTDLVMSKALADAERMGRELGTAHAAWVFDGNTDRATYLRAINMAEDGDPAWHDHFGWPSGALSGEHADDLTPRSLMTELGLHPDRVNDADSDALCSRYEDAHDVAYADTVIATARRMVDDEHVAFHERSMLPMGSSLCAWCAA